MTVMLPFFISHLSGSLGYGGVALVVALESMGVPLPGETTLVLAAVYAGGTGDLAIGGVVASAALGAILGDNVGYWLGREYGFRLLLRTRGRFGITASRIKLGQYLFLRHGTKVVFWGRFVALLRVLAAVLAGVNRMPWRSFVLANMAGGVVWASLFGFGAYQLGDQARRLAGPAGWVVLGVALIGFIAAGRVVKHHHARFEAEAEKALPGPLAGVG